jgi:membrane protein YqaA with SNARE-associated domain
MAEELVTHFGYFGLLLASFLAATLLPFSSELIVLGMAQLGFNKGLILLCATTGNCLGALTNYYVGKVGDRFILARYLSRDDATVQKAQRIYQRWGAPILFFSWLPIIGDPLTVIPGLLHCPLPTFAFWVILGRALRYSVVLWLAAFWIG